MVLKQMSKIKSITADYFKIMRDNKLNLVGFIIVTLFFLIALFANYITPYDPYAMNLDVMVEPPSWEHPLGTDDFGRDVLSRLLFGSRVSLTVGLIAVAFALVGGVLFGSIAGYYSGTKIDDIIMRIMDVLLSIPTLVFGMSIIGLIGVKPFQVGPLLITQPMKIGLIFGFLSMSSLSRIVRSSVISISQENYVLAKKIEGASDMRIIFNEILPNALSPTIIQATFLVAIIIVLEASLSFIGIGVQPPEPSWGVMLTDAKDLMITGYWWLGLFPGIFIILLAAGFNFIGDGLRDMLDPRREKLRKI